MTIKFLWVLFILCAAKQGPSVAAENITYPAGWQVNRDPKERELAPLKGEKHSLLSWSGDPAELLDIRRWILTREQRDSTPEEQIRRRLASVPERIGKIIRCEGDCRIYRGVQSTPARWQSRLVEGDEVQTGPDSYLWLMLTDGTLVRLAPESALGLLEINLSATEVFYHARLAQGLVHWQPRSGRQQQVAMAAETDPLMLPVMDVEANREWFQRQLKGQRDEAQQVSSWFSENSWGGVREQWDALNQLVTQNNQFMNRAHRYLLVAPNGSLVAEEVAVSWFYGSNQLSYFKLNTRDDVEVGERSRPWKAQFLFRGYGNDKATTISEAEWMSVTADGRELQRANDSEGQLAVSELLTKRLPTYLLARERWLASQARLWDQRWAPLKLAREWGYRLWTKESLDERIKFLQEYSRRIETTHLSALHSLASTASNVAAHFSSRYFGRALEAYYLSLKRHERLSEGSRQDMADVHFYGWILSHADK